MYFEKPKNLDELSDFVLIKHCKRYTEKNQLLDWHTAKLLFWIEQLLNQEVNFLKLFIFTMCYMSLLYEYKPVLSSSALELATLQ